MKFDYLIVGAGLFGAVFAHEATNAGKKCLVIDKRNHIFFIQVIRKYGTMLMSLQNLTIT